MLQSAIPWAIAGLGGALMGVLGKDYMETKKEDFTKGLLAKPIDVDIPTDVKIDIPTMNYSPVDNFSYVYQPVITFNSPNTRASAITKKQQRAENTTRQSNQPNLPMTLPELKHDSSGFKLDETTILILGGLGIGALILLKK